jgi:cytochrome P450
MNELPPPKLISMADPAVSACPFPAYAQLREEAPVYLDPMTKMYVITRYDDIKAVCADPATYSNDTSQLANRDTPAKHEITRLLQEADFLPVPTLITNDPPSHALYRTLVDRAFNPRRIREIEPRIMKITHELIDLFPSGEAFEFVDSFATPLPIRMIAEQLGVPPEMAKTFKEWSDATLEAADFSVLPERQIECMKRQIEMWTFFWDSAKKLREKPEDFLFSDIANAEIEGRPISRQELSGILSQILVAGNETTTTTMAACLHRLATRPALQDELRGDPAKIRNFCEEVLRLEAPIQGLFRRATKAVTLRDVDIPEGAILNLRWGGGNLDPRQFACPEALDLNRSNSASHLTFGSGVHFCIGNQLARAELKGGVQQLLAMTRHIRLADVAQPVEPIQHFFAYGFKQIWIEVEK